MPRYLIDIRLMGPVERQIRALSRRLDERFHLGSNLSVPHITLAGPFTTGDEARLVREFSRVCTGMQDIPAYTVGGYGFFDRTRVVYVEIIPNPALRQFRYDLAQALVPSCSLREYDLDPAESFRFHATLAMKLTWLTYHRIKWHFRNQEAIVHRPHPVRATLLRDTRILCEYDFSRERMLSPARARGRAQKKRDADSLRMWADDDSLLG